MIDEKFIFTNAKGQVVEIGNAAPFILNSYDGTGAVQSDVQLQKSPFQDGKTRIGSEFDIRQITIQLTIMASSQNELFSLRALLLTIFNSKLGEGRLDYIHNGAKREILATVESGPIFLSGNENRSSRIQVVMLHLIAPNPYWMDTDYKTERLQDFVGGLTYPIITPNHFTKRGNPSFLINDGQVPVPIEFEFIGPAVNPRIENADTGEFIQINRSINEGDRLIVNTERGANKKLEIIRTDGTKESAWHYAELPLSLFYLPVGTTQIKFTADEGTREASMIARWRNWYIGI